MDSIYNEVLIDHNLHPTHRNEKIDANAHLSATNDSCGDALEFDFEIKDGRIAKASFNGVGCAVSQASADIMADLLVGKTIDEAQDLQKMFFDLIKTGKENQSLADANALRGISEMPARVKCAELAWSVIPKLVAIV